MKRNQRILALLILLCLSVLPVFAADVPANPYAGAEEPLKSFQAARACLKAGDYEKAFSIHEWMFKNIESLHPNDFFIYVDSLAYDWYQVALHYPPAMKALLSQRDECESRLRAAAAQRLSPNSKKSLGMKIVYREVIAFNQWLGDESRSADFHDAVAKGSPEFARTMYSLVRAALFTSKRYDILAKYEPSPEEAVESYALVYHAFLRGRPDLRQVADKDFADKVIDSMDAYFAMGSDEKAEKVRTLALQVLDSPAIRNHRKKGAAGR